MHVWLSSYAAVLRGSSVISSKKEDIQKYWPDVLITADNILINNLINK